MTPVIVVVFFVFFAFILTLLSEECNTRYLIKFSILQCVCGVNLETKTEHNYMIQIGMLINFHITIRTFLTF